VNYITYEIPLKEVFKKEINIAISMTQDENYVNINLANQLLSSDPNISCNVPKPIFSLGTLTAHCLTDVCVFACRFTSELGLRVYSSVNKHRSEDITMEIQDMTSNTRYGTKQHRSDLY
jgi:hypothetical protein